MFRIALSNLRARKARALLAAAAITLGVAFMSATLVLTDTLGSTYTDVTASATAGTLVAISRITSCKRHRPIVTSTKSQLSSSHACPSRRAEGARRSTKMDSTGTPRVMKVST